MTHLARISLADGRSLLVDAPTTREGPVTEAGPLYSPSCARPTPDAVTFEFGVALACEAGAVITKSSVNCHLRVTMAREKKSAGPSTGPKAD